VNRLVAITGGIAEGKSTVLEIVQSKGFKTVSSDDVAKSVFALPDIQWKLAALSQLTIPIDRQKLRDAMAEQPALRRGINAVMHPAIREAMRSSEAQFHEVPLLIEACLQSEYDQVWVVTCGAQEQRRRLKQRLGDHADIEAILATQLSTKVKTVFADQIIRTNQPIETVRMSIEAVLRDEF
jgi:dephospho-CoA kinase